MSLKGSGSARAITLLGCAAVWYGAVGAAPAQARLCWNSVMGEAGTNGPVHAFAVFDDGSGAALYIGGSFTIAGGVEANRIARWDGNAFSALGTGMEGAVRALAVFDDGDGPALYAGGDFTTAGGTQANHIARWDGTAWVGVGTGVDDTVNALAGFDDQSGSGPALYAAGTFTNAGTVEANRIARWDVGAGAWTALGDGLGGTGSVSAMVLAVHEEESGTGLYVGGTFTTAGGTEANNIAKWDGVGWASLDTEPGGSVTALATFDDGSSQALFAGGFFAMPPGPIEHLARWDGEQWTGLGLSSGSVNALAAFDDGRGVALYAAGTFAVAGVHQADSIARWDGRNWETLSTGLGGVAHALAGFDGGGAEALYVGGHFITTGPVAAANLGAWGEAFCPEPPLPGSCFLAHGGHGCQSFGCTLQVSAIDPFCLLVAWDAECAALAQKLCHAYQQDSGGVSIVLLIPAMADKGGTLGWMNQFVVVPGAEVLTDVLISWPTFTFPPYGPLEGLPATLYVWSDPSQDGHPHDAQVIASIPVAFGPPTGEFESYAIDPVYVGPPGTRFFVGGAAAANDNQVPMVSTQFQTAPSGKSWIVWTFGKDPLDPDGLLEADFQFHWPHSNIMVRAIGHPGPDLTGDGTVGVDDLLLLLAQWGECSDCGVCPADLTGDCAVGIDDLLILLANWG